MKFIPDELIIKNNVYPPASDTFTLLDGILSDLDNILNLNPILITEIGCGSGYISTNLLLELNKHNLSPFLLYCDVNPYAIDISLDVSRLNNTIHYTEAVRGSLLEWTNSEFDIIIFNPPYVPCDKFETTEYNKRLLELSYDGGPNGNHVIDKFLATSLKNLRANGFIYLLLEKQNKPEIIIRGLEEQGYVVTNLVTRKSYNEVYYIIKISKNQAQIKTCEN